MIRGITQGMRKYERWRKSANIPVINLMDGFDKGFRTSSQAMRMMLGLGLTIHQSIEHCKAEYHSPCLRYFRRHSENCQAVLKFSLVSTSVRSHLVELRWERRLDAPI